MGKIIKSLKRLKYDYLKEPHIPVVENGVRTTRKPDIVFWSERKGLSVVLDVSVHRDNLKGQTRATKQKWPITIEPK